MVHWFMFLERTISRRRGHLAVFVAVLDVLSPLPVAACSMYRKLALFRELLRRFADRCDLGRVPQPAAQLNATPEAAEAA